MQYPDRAAQSCHLPDDWAAEARWLAGPDGGPLSDRLDLLDRADPRPLREPAPAPMPGLAFLLTCRAACLRILSTPGLEARNGQALAPNLADRRLRA